MTLWNPHHTSTPPPAARQPTPEELRYHIARGKQMQAQAVAESLATLGRGLYRMLGISRFTRGRLAVLRRRSAQEHRRAQLRTERELMAYSDRELNELGIARRDIPLIARTG